MDRTERRGIFAAIAALLAVLCAHLLINLQLTVYSDDYWYGTYLKDGLYEFARKTYHHYLEQNGRVLIHILIPFILLFDTKLFAVLSPLITAAIFAVGLYVSDRELTLTGIIFGGAMGLLTVLGSEIQYLRMSLYWLSAFFNYAAPLLPTLGVLALAARETEKPLSRWGYAAAIIVALIAGATTEQIGIIALIFIWGVFIFQPKGSHSKRLLMLALAVSAGYMTILLAPGSHARVDRGIEGGILSFLVPEVFARRFFDVMSYLTGYGLWNGLFTGLCLLSALTYVADRSLPKLLLLGFPMGTLTVILWLTGLNKLLSVLTVCYTLFMAIVMLTSKPLRVTGLILLGAGASVMFLVVTTLYYARTFFPCVLLTVLTCWSLMLRVLRRAPKWAGAAVCIALAALFVARFLPMYRGYRENRVTVERNLRAVEAARSTGEAELSIDFDDDYRFTMFFEGSYFLDNFLAYYGLPADTHVKYVSDRWDVSAVEAGGTELRFPAVELEGETYFPVEHLMAAAGGSAHFNWQDHSYTVSWRGHSYFETEEGELYLTDGGEKTLVDANCRYVMPFSYTYTILYMSESTLRRCFGISFTYDPSADIYLLDG